MSRGMRLFAADANSSGKKNNKFNLTSLLRWSSVCKKQKGILFVERCCCDVCQKWNRRSHADVKSADQTRKATWVVTAHASEVRKKSVSGGLSYKGGGFIKVKRRLGRWYQCSLKKWMTPLHPAWLPKCSRTRIASHWVNYWRHPSILFPSHAVILKPTTKASGLISSAPHQAPQRPGSHPREVR